MHFDNGRAFYISVRIRRLQQAPVSSGIASEMKLDVGLRFAGLPMSSLRDLMQCENVGSVVWFVHECMEWVDNSHTG
jgi:hypothetical protein